MPEKIIRVQFQPSGRRGEVPKGSTLLEAARWAGIELNSTCGGQGSCGQCQVVVLEGQVSEPSLDEVSLLGQADIARGRRLACLTRVYSSVIAEIPRDSITTSQRLQIESDLSAPYLQSAPLVRAVPISMSKPTLADVRSDFTRVSSALSEGHGFPELRAHIDVIRSLPVRLRENNWQLTAFVRGDTLVGLAAPGLRALGYCVDLGTTKIAASLVDMETGQILASAGAPNPQLGYGEDVISRINYVQRSPDGAKILAEKVQGVLDQILSELIAMTGARCEQVVEGCIVGNAVMIHLLLRLPVRQLSFAPYVSAFSDAVEVHAATLGIEMAPGAQIYFPPSVGGFIGSDHIAMMLACDFDRTSKVSLGIDIGTNTEIVIRRPGSSTLASASCASGPAFEGAHIREGMRASSGAIERVEIDADGVKIETIHNEAPVGLCGSGIIDIAAEMFSWGMINRQGTFQAENPRVRQGRNGGEFLLVPAERSGTGRDIVIDQKDINEIQLAKGAIHAGLQLLMNVTETLPEAVEEVIIAGAFGSYIDVAQAAAIGLFPKLPNAVYRQVGNAALVGARDLLISQAARQRAAAMQKNTQYLELTGNPGFNRIFAKGMLFPNLEEDH